MRLSGLFVRLRGLTLSARANFENVRIGVMAVCFALFPLSGSWAQIATPPSSCAGYSWCNNGAGGYTPPVYASPPQQYVAPQPYVPPPPSPAQIAAQRAHELNDAGNRAYTAGNYALAVTLYERASRLTPNDAVIAKNLRNARGEVLNVEGAAAAAAGNWPLALRLQEQAAQLNPNDAVIADNVRMDRANVFNDEGNKIFEAGDTALAQKLYEQALQANPNSSVIAGNLERARAAQDEERVNLIKYEQLKQEQQQRDKITATNMQQAIQNLALSSSAVPSSSGSDLTFLPGGSTTARDNTNGQNIPAEIAAANKGTTGTHLFGTTSNPADLDFMGVDLSRDATKPAAVKNATDQLSSAAQSGADANKPGISDEAAKAESNCAFDKDACANFQSIDTSKVRAIGQTPGAGEVSTHIPDAAKNDKQIQQSMAYYQKLDSLKIDTQTKLAAIEQKIKKKEGGAKQIEVLDAEKSQLSFDLNQFNESQKTVTKQIKEHLTTINTPWIEDPAPAPAVGPAAPGANQ